MLNLKSIKQSTNKKQQTLKDLCDKYQVKIKEDDINKPIMEKFKFCGNR